MTRRTATVLNIGRVSMPDDGEDVLQVWTDFEPRGEGCFYLAPDSPEPEVGQPITYGDNRAWYSVAGKMIVARKRGYNFSADAPLH